jgi:tetratricopeptide (TPR) repeat protein
VEWGTPVLYLRAPDGRIFDVERVSEEERKSAQAATLYRQAQAAMTREDWGAATEKLRAVLALEPGHVEAVAALNQARRGQELAALYARGREYYAAGRWGEALEYFRRVQHMGGTYKDVDALVATVERSMARKQATPAPQPAPSKSSNWLRLAVPAALVLLVLLCCGGYAAYKTIFPILVPTPTPEVMGGTTPVPPAVVSTPTRTPAPTPIPREPAAPTPTPKIMSFGMAVMGVPPEQEAVLDEVVELAVPWAQLGDYFPDRVIELARPVRDPLFTHEADWDPEKAFQMLEEAGLSGLSLQFVIVADANMSDDVEEVLVVMAEFVVGHLGDINISVAGPDWVPVDQAADYVNNLVDAGETILFLEPLL